MWHECGCLSPEQHSSSAMTSPNFNLKLLKHIFFFPLFFLTEHSQARVFLPNIIKQPKNGVQNLRQEWNRPFVKHLLK